MSFCASRSTRLVERTNKQRRRTPKTVMPFPKWNVNIKIQSKTFIMLALLILLHICYNEYIDYCKSIEKYIYDSKKLPFTSYPITQHDDHWQRLRRTIDALFVTVAPTKTLFIEVPCQKVSVPVYLEFIGFTAYNLELSVP